MTLKGQINSQPLFQSSQKTLETIGDLKKGEWLSSKKNGKIIKVSGKFGKMWHVIRNTCSLGDVNKRTNTIITTTCENLSKELNNSTRPLSDLKAVELKIDRFLHNLGSLSKNTSRKTSANKVREAFNSEISKELLSGSSRRTVWSHRNSFNSERTIKEKCETVYKLIKRSPDSQKTAETASVIIEKITGKNLRKLKKQFPNVGVIDQLMGLFTPSSEKKPAHSPPTPALTLHPITEENIQDAGSVTSSPPASPEPRTQEAIFESMGIVPTDETNNPQILPLDKEEILPQLDKALGIDTMENSPMKATKRMAVDTIQALLYPLVNVQARVSTKEGIVTLTVESDKFVKGDTKYKSKIPYDPMLNKNMVFTIREDQGNLIVELSDDALLMEKVSYRKGVEIGNSASLIARKDVVKGLNIATPQKVKSFTFSSKGNKPEDVEAHMDVTDLLPEAWRWDAKQVKAAQKWGHDKFYDTYNSDKRALAERFAASTWNYGCLLKEKGKADVLLRMFSPWKSKGEGDDGRTKWTTQSPQEFQKSKAEDEQSWTDRELSMSWTGTVS